MGRHQTGDDHDYEYIKSNERRKSNMENYKCPICGNTDIHSIGILNGKPYCRKCISFRGEKVQSIFLHPKEANINLGYSLSSEQTDLSDRLIENYKLGIDCLVNAVCGSGKTEICLGLIQYCIQAGLKVGFAVPRRSVCYELYARFKNIFKNNCVVAVFGGHHNKLIGDIVCLTTHQLFRYNGYFDLLIMDEIDAFPFKGNQVLQKMFENSVRGHYVLLSATPSKELIQEFQKPGKEVLSLFARFHHHELPVPTVKVGNYLKIYYILIKQVRKFIKQNKQIFIFVPTIDESIKTAKLLNVFFRKGTHINSKSPNREELIDDFRDKKMMYLVTTAVLERGITVKDLQVIVFKADHPIYDDASLIQIAGRAGRKKDAPEGEVIFIGETKTEYMERAISEINAANEKLQNMLQGNQNI